MGVRGAREGDDSPEALATRISLNNAYLVYKAAPGTLDLNVSTPYGLSLLLYINNAEYSASHTEYH